MLFFTLYIKIDLIIIIFNFHDLYPIDLIPIQENVMADSLVKLVIFTLGATCKIPIKTIKLLNMSKADIVSY